MKMPTQFQMDRGRSVALGSGENRIRMYKSGNYYVVRHQGQSAAYWSYLEAREHVARLLIIIGALYGSARR